MTKALYVATSLTLLAVPSIASAQYYPPVYQSRASTVGESHARGMSDIINSAGQANLANSEAANNYEDARSKNLDNRLKGTDTYFEMRAKNRAYREAERGPRPTREDLARYAKLRAPQRLSPSELDPLTGKIRWPVILLEDNFEGDRKNLDTIFAERSKNGYLRLKGINEATDATDQLAADMRKNIKEYPPQLYASTRRFLKSLRREVTVPTQ